MKSEIVGGRRYTSREAIEQFLRELNPDESQKAGKVGEKSEAVA